MNVEVIMPWRDSGCPARKRAFDFVYSLYSREYPVRLCDAGGDEFNRAATRNAGVAESSADVVIVADADLFVPLSQIRTAVEVAASTRLQVRPFTQFGHLRENGTVQFIEREDHSMITHERFNTLATLWPGVHGGVFVIQRSLWLEAGGMDERFTGWGGEDNAFNAVCEEMFGPVHLVQGYAYHLFHPTRRRMSADNAALLDSYLRKREGQGEVVGCHLPVG